MNLATLMGSTSKWRGSEKAMTLPLIFSGIAILLLGRKLFWFFMGVAGFAAGLILAVRLLDGVSGMTRLLISLGIGLVCALLVLLMQRFALTLAGFAAGTYFIYGIIHLLRIEAGGILWLAMIVGGLVGAVLIIKLFDWTLIFLSSLAGAMVVVQALGLVWYASLGLFIMLFVLGLLAQFGIKRSERRK